MLIVVYFDQQMGALHAFCWSKLQKFFHLFLSQMQKKKKKGIFPHEVDQLWVSTSVSEYHLNALLYKLLKTAISCNVIIACYLFFALCLLFFCFWREKVLRCPKRWFQPVNVKHPFADWNTQQLMMLKMIIWGNEYIVEENEYCSFSPKSLLYFINGGKKRFVLKINFLLPFDLQLTHFLKSVYWSEEPRAKPIKISTLNPAVVA